MRDNKKIYLMKTKMLIFNTLTLLINLLSLIYCCIVKKLKSMNVGLLKAPWWDLFSLSYALAIFTRFSWHSLTACGWFRRGTDFNVFFSILQLLRDQLINNKDHIDSLHKKGVYRLTSNYCPMSYRMLVEASVTLEPVLKA